MAMVQSLRLVRANILSPSFSPNRISCHLISLKFDTAIENFQRLQLVLSNLSSSFHCKLCKVLSYLCFTQSSVSISAKTRGGLLMAMRRMNLLLHSCVSLFTKNSI